MVKNWIDSFWFKQCMILHHKNKENLNSGEEISLRSLIERMKIGGKESVKHVVVTSLQPMFNHTEVNSNTQLLLPIISPTFSTRSVNYIIAN